MKAELEVEPQLDYRGKPRVQTSFDGPEGQSMTIQSDAKKSDIKFILAQYRQVGIVENLNQAEAQFRDISEFEDFGAAMLHAKQAESEFMLLPSKVREIFNHDVGQWLDTAHDPEKRDALIEAGIIEGPRVDAGAAEGQEEGSTVVEDGGGTEPAGGGEAVS